MAPRVRVLHGVHTHTHRKHNLHHQIWLDIFVSIALTRGGSSSYALLLLSHTSFKSKHSFFHSFRMLYLHEKWICPATTATAHCEKRAGTRRVTQYKWQIAVDSTKVFFFFFINAGHLFLFPICSAALLPFCRNSPCRLY